MMLQPFEADYRRLCAGFGIAFNEARCRIYFDTIGKTTETHVWERMVSKWLDTGSSFPKISDLKAMSEYTCTEKGTPQDVVGEFIKSDCEIVECNAGWIHVGVTRGNRIMPLLQPDGTFVQGFWEREVSFRCPACNRVAPCGVPDWHGEVTRRSQKEMNERLAERRERGAEIRKGHLKIFTAGGMI